MNIRPLNHRIVVKCIEADDSPVGEIVMLDSAIEKLQQGEVVAICRGKRFENRSRSPRDVAVGDHILFGKHSGSKIKLIGQEYLIMREDDVLGVLESAEKSETKVA
jgi:chaperonin GroES